MQRYFSRGGAYTKVEPGVETQNSYDANFDAPDAHLDGLYILIQRCLRRKIGIRNVTTVETQQNPSSALKWSQIR
jgi:hypothetical protein